MPHNCYPKLIPNAISQIVPKAIPKGRHRKLLRIAAPNICSRKLFTKLFPKVFPESCSPKLIPPQPQSYPRAALQSQSWPPKLFPTSIPKNTPESNSTQLSKLAAKNCSPKFLVNLNESCCASKQIFLKIIPESCRSSKLFPEIALQSCPLELLSKSYCPKATILQIYTPKLAPQSCSPKLLLRAAPRSCKATTKSCPPNSSK